LLNEVIRAKVSIYQQGKNGTPESGIIVNFPGVGNWKVIPKTFKNWEKEASVWEYLGNT